MIASLLINRSFAKLHYLEILGFLKFTSCAVRRTCDRR
jgi:hypothetical protein